MCVCVCVCVCMYMFFCKHYFISKRNRIGQQAVPILSPLLC